MSDFRGNQICPCSCPWKSDCVWRLIYIYENMYEDSISIIFFWSWSLIYDIGKFSKLEYVFWNSADSVTRTCNGYLRQGFFFFDFYGPSRIFCAFQCDLIKWVGQSRSLHALPQAEYCLHPQSNQLQWDRNSNHLCDNRDLLILDKIHTPDMTLHACSMMDGPCHEKPICKQQRRRSACASAQSDQRLCCLLPR